MLYALTSDLLDRFGALEIAQLTDRTGADAVDETVSERALQDAAAEIDGHIAARYILPLPRVPRILVGYACDIARYRLYDDRATEQVTKRYDDAIKYLRLIADGKATLGADVASALIPDPTQPDSGASPKVGPVRTTGAAARVFSQDLLRDFTQ